MPGQLRPEIADLVGAWIPLTRYPIGDTAHLALYWTRPPSEPVAVHLAGPVSEDIPVPAPTPAQSGLTRQQVAIALRPDLPGGDYDVYVRAANAAVKIGHFTLVSRGVGNVVTLADIPSPLNVRFEPSIRLLGYGLPRATAEPGGAVELILYWQTEAALDARYKVFTHLLGEEWNADANNFVWGQQDNEPQNGLAPTTTWAPGIIIADPYLIPLSPDAPPGRYTLEVGLYGLVDDARLPILDASGEPQGDALVLAEVEVK